MSITARAFSMDPPGVSAIHDVQSPYVRDSSTPDRQRQAEAGLQASPADARMAHMFQ